MKLIVGLGNPGEKYQNNRHNAGYMFIDYLRNELQRRYSDEFKERKMLHLTSYMLHDLVLSKPQAFMNQSGIAVGSCVTRYKLHVTSDLFVAHDDLDIPLGKFKVQKGVGPKLHNGILSVEQHLKTADFWRIRIGVDNRNPENWLDGETYVLQDFTEEEKQIINKTFPIILNSLQTSHTIF